MEGLVLYPDGQFKLEEVPKPEIGKNPFAPNDVLIEVAYCRFYGSYAHKWKTTERKDSKRSSKAVA
ncbi:MAG: hypothetical protein ABSB32_00010 [Thermodesulfobacteriota bacterium]|jgi:(R,R)-butanediol dehydrogenase/meso-butanediol dehydrogenase/diacetyl reductase/L-iditol 2-dehydrogenase